MFFCLGQYASTVSPWQGRQALPCLKSKIYSIKSNRTKKHISARTCCAPRRGLRLKSGVRVHDLCLGARLRAPGDDEGDEDGEGDEDDEDDEDGEGHNEDDEGDEDEKDYEDTLLEQTFLGGPHLGRNRYVSQHREQAVACCMGVLFLREDKEVQDVVWLGRLQQLWLASVRGVLRLAVGPSGGFADMCV